MHVTAKEDPWYTNSLVARQLQKQVQEENALQKSVIIMQQNSEHFEEGVIRAIQTAWETFDNWSSRFVFHPNSTLTMLTKEQNVDLCARHLGYYGCSHEVSPAKHRMARFRRSLGPPARSRDSSAKHRPHQLPWQGRPICSPRSRGYARTQEALLQELHRGLLCSYPCWILARACVSVLVHTSSICSNAYTGHLMATSTLSLVCLSSCLSALLAHLPPSTPALTSSTLRARRATPTPSPSSLVDLLLPSPSAHATTKT